MEKALATYITHKYCEINRNNNKSTSAIHYKLEILLINLLKNTFALVISYLFFDIKKTLLVLIIFVSLRIFIDGYHAKTSRRCTLLTILTLVILPNYIPSLHLVTWHVLIVLILCFSVFIFFPLRTSFSSPKWKKTKKILNFIFLVHLVIIVTQPDLVVNLEVYSVFTTLILLLLGILQERRVQK